MNIDSVESEKIKNSSISGISDIYASNVQKYLYALVREVGIEPTETPILRVSVESSWLIVVYVEKDGTVYKLKTEYPIPVSGVK